MSAPSDPRAVHEAARLNLATDKAYHLLGWKPAWDFAKRIEEHMKGFVAPATLFEELGFNYVGPIDGHNFDHLLPVLQIRRVQNAAAVLERASQLKRIVDLITIALRKCERALVRGNRERLDFAQGADGAELFVDLAPGAPICSARHW